MSGRRPPVRRLPSCRGDTDVGSDEDGREHHPGKAGLKTALHGIAGVVNKNSGESRCFSFFGMIIVWRFVDKIFSGGIIDVENTFTKEG